MRCFAYVRHRTDFSNILQRRDELLEARIAAYEDAVTDVVKDEAITLKSHLAMMARLRDEARAMGQCSAAITAERNRGVLMGFYVERKEVGHPGDFAELTDEQLKAKMAETLAKARAEAEAKAAIAKASA